MTLARLKETFGHLPKEIKMIGGGSLLLGISTLLPWYADVDAYKIGDEFLGITGPTSLMGISVLVLAGLSFWIFSYRLFEKRMPKLPFGEAALHLFVGLEALFVLVLVNSVYFHSKFGVNITLKQSRFGMAAAFLGAVTILFGAHWLRKREKRDAAPSEGRLEPLIKLEEPAILKGERGHHPIGGARAASLTPQQRLEIQRNFLFGESKLNVPPSQEAPPVLKKEEKKGGDSGSYMYRSDL